MTELQQRADIELIVHRFRVTLYPHEQEKLDTILRDVVEECCKAECEECKKGRKVYVLSTVDGVRHYHGKRFSKNWNRCRAWKIRKALGGLLGGGE